MTLSENGQLLRVFIANRTPGRVNRSTGDRAPGQGPSVLLAPPSCTGRWGTGQQPRAHHESYWNCPPTCRGGRDC